MTEPPKLLVPASHNVVVPTVYGPMIVNRHAGEYDMMAKCGRSLTHADIEIVCTLAWCCGPDSLVIDVGACFGTYTLALAKLLAPIGGRVMSFEPQMWLYQCMTGSLALNDISNVDSRPYAVGAASGIVTVPGLDYTKTASFGSLPILEFADDTSYGDIGQEVDHERSVQVPMIAIDDLHVRPSLIKIDTEGMELEVLKGAEGTISRNRPVIYFEHIKSDKDALVAWVEARDYQTYVNGCDYACLPREKRERFPQFEYEPERVTERVGVFGG